MGWIQKNHFNQIVELYGSDNRLIMTAEKPADVDEVAATVITEAWKRLFYLKFINYLRMVFDYFTALDKYKVDEDHDLILQEGALKHHYAIRDTQNNVVASCDLGNICNLKISTNPEHTVDKRHIIALSLVISGV